MKVEIKSITTLNITKYIAEFARVCTDRDTVTTDPNKDLNMCKSLWKNGHHTPFESINIDFLIEDVSRSLLAQITRYRHMTFNVESQRYVKYKDINFIYPEVSGDSEIWIKHSFDEAKLSYEKALESGCKPEDARCVLPNATPTRFRVVMNLREFFHFYEQRSNAHAQKEIRDLATMMFNELHEHTFTSITDGAALLEFIRESLHHTLGDIIKELSVARSKGNREVFLDEFNKIMNDYKQYT